MSNIFSNTELLKKTLINVKNKLKKDLEQDIRLAELEDNLLILFFNIENNNQEINLKEPEESIIIDWGDGEVEYFEKECRYVNSCI